MAPLKGTNQGTKKPCNLFQKVAEPEFKPLPVRHCTQVLCSPLTLRIVCQTQGALGRYDGIGHASRPILKATKGKGAGSQVRDAKPVWTGSAWTYP